MNYPEYVEVDGIRYKINTDFRYVLKCQEIAKSDVSDYEKIIGTIVTLFGKDGLKCKKMDKLLSLAMKYINCGKENKENKVNNENIDMDFKQDFGLILASFRSVHIIDLTKEKLHWWEFYDLLNGLTEECALNRVREIRNVNLNDISDNKEKDKIRKAQKFWALEQEPVQMTEEQLKSVATFYELTGLKRKGE